LADALEQARHKDRTSFKVMSANVQRRISIRPAGYSPNMRRQKPRLRMRVGSAAVSSAFACAASRAL
jgi:hypothetical protein